MARYIDKEALVAEIEKLESRFQNGYDEEYADGYHYSLELVKRILDTLEVKEVDLEKEIDTWYQNKASKEFEKVFYEDIEDCAKYFFELGLSINNPITAADRGTAEEIIINLKRVEKDYCINLSKEMEWLRNKVKKG